MQEHSVDPTNGDNTPTSIIIDKIALNYLNETRKWSSILAIWGFICIGLLLIMAIFSGTLFSAYDQMAQMSTMPYNPSIFIAVVYVLVGVLYLFPTLYLYKFSTQLKAALSNMDTDSLTEAFKNQKSLYKFMGILVIILIGLYALVFVGAGFALLLA
tara:strand:- start:53 stop:523 length:471 start_codon:yes stop_codon:yes gene_type:complete